jgi:trehalose 6-phosphate phosphatase
MVRSDLLCAFDFDGTLAPFVTQPEKARVPLGIAQRLAELSNHAPVAIITGRSAADVHSRLGFEPAFVIGNHGLEGLPGAEHLAQGYRDLCREWEAQLEAALRGCASVDYGIWIENKGCSLSVHYRLARSQADAHKQLAGLIARLSPHAHVIGGNCVFNLLPQGAGNKGVAFERLMQLTGVPNAIYVGDDDTDEDIFRLRRSDLLSVRIGHANNSAAEFFLPHRLGIVQLLDDLIRRLRLARADRRIKTAAHA